MPLDLFNLTCTCHKFFFLVLSFTSNRRIRCNSYTDTESWLMSLPLHVLACRYWIFLEFMIILTNFCDGTTFHHLWEYKILFKRDDWIFHVSEVRSEIDQGLQISYMYTHNQFNFLFINIEHRWRRRRWKARICELEFALLWVPNELLIWLGPRNPVPWFRMIVEINSNSIGGQTRPWVKLANWSATVLQTQVPKLRCGSPNASTEVVHSPRSRSPLHFDIGNI